MNSLRFLAVVLSALAYSAPSLAQESLQTAIVTIDGRVLVRARGIAPYLVDERAERIQQAVIGIAENRNIDAAGATKIIIRDSL